MSSDFDDAQVSRAASVDFSAGHALFWHQPELASESWPATTTATASQML